MARRELAVRLKYLRTLRLVIFCCITLGIYVAHYINRQTKILNRFSATDKISGKLVTGVFVLTYLNVLLTLPFLFIIEPGEAITPLIRGLNNIWAILIIVWSFNARHIMNARFHAKPGDTAWFNAILTFLLTIFYFNYKVNKIGNHYATKEAFDLPGR